MRWNWQHPDWPEFTWDDKRLRSREDRFLRQAGVAIGAQAALGNTERQELTVSLMSGEAFDTSRIEGEVLDRESLQASIRRYLGLSADRRSGPTEAGIGEMVVDLYRTLGNPVTAERLWRWHAMTMNGRRDLSVIGHYRVHEDPMEIVSGPISRRRVHFQAPPSSSVPREMDRLLAWLADTAPGANGEVPALARAGVAHLWLETIHPFEDGNGRIGRAVVENTLAQSAGHPALTGISGAILARRKAYYRALEQTNRTLDLNQWLDWFSGTVLEAQRRSYAQVVFCIEKGRLLRQCDPSMNERQRKAVLRVLDEGIDGFKGGLSAENYRRITGAPVSTATRDLSGLVEMGALWRTGERKGTRYHPAIRFPEKDTDDLSGGP